MRERLGISVERAVGQASQLLWEGSKRHCGKRGSLTSMAL